MLVNKNIVWMMSVAVIFAAVGCGSGANDSGDKSTGTPQDTTQDDNNESNLTSSYVSGNGILIETRGNQTLTWVNTTGDAFCKISRSTNRTGTVYQDGIAHCRSLSVQAYAGLTTWRLPTVQESQNLMKLENKSILLFPQSNPHCAIMTTSSENRFVYTTSDWNIRDHNPIGGSFIDAARNNKTAGIRCVADQ